MTISAGSLFDKIYNNGNQYTKSYTKQVREADEDVETFQGKLVGFKQTVKSIHNYSSTNTTDEKLKSYLTDLTDNYNSLIKNKDSISNDSIQKQLDKLETLIDDNAKSLKKLGLTKNDDGQLEFDDETFDDNIDENTKTVKNLFEGTDSFGDQLYKITRTLDRIADNAQYVTNTRHLSSTTKYSDADMLKASVYLNEQQGASLLNSYVNHSNNGTTIDYNSADNKPYINLALSNICIGLSYSSESDKVMESYEANKDNLSTIGITYDESTKKFSYSEPTSIDADAFDALFKSDDNSFYNIIDEHSKENYNSIIKPDSLGVTIDSYI